MSVSMIQDVIDPNDIQPTFGSGTWWRRDEVQCFESHIWCMIPESWDRVEVPYFQRHMWGAVPESWLLILGRDSRSVNTDTQVFRRHKDVHFAFKKEI